MAVHRGLIAVRGESIDGLVPVAGALEAAARSPAELPATGDWVAVRDGEAIRHVLPRRKRARAHRRGRARGGAGRQRGPVPRLTSLNQDLNLRRLERFVALARGGGVPVLLVCTKGDLSRDPIGEAARSPPRPSASRGSCSARVTAGA